MNCLSTKYIGNSTPKNLCTIWDHWDNPQQKYPFFKFLNAVNVDLFLTTFLEKIAFIVNFHQKLAPFVGKYPNTFLFQNYLRRKFFLEWNNLSKFLKLKSRAFFQKGSGYRRISDPSVNNGNCRQDFRDECRWYCQLPFTIPLCT